MKRWFILLFTLSCLIGQSEVMSLKPAEAKRLNEAEQLRQKGELDEALAALADSEDGPTPLQLMRVVVLLELGRFREAAEVMTPIYEAHQTDPQVQVMQSRVLLAQDRYKQALKVLEPLPMDDPETLKLRAFAAENSGDDALAVLFYQHWLMEEPGSTAARWGLVRCYWQDERFESALPVLKSLLTVNPEKFDHWQALAYTFMQLDRSLEAAATLLTAEQRLQLPEQSKLDLVRLLMQNDLAKLADEHLLNRLQRGSVVQLPGAVLELAGSLLAAQQIKVAEWIIAHSAEFEKQPEWALFKARYLLGHGDLEAARSAVLAVSATESQLPWFFLQLAGRLEEVERFDEALSVYESAYRLDAESRAAGLGILRQYANLGQLSRALQWGKQLQQKAHDSNLAVYLVELEQYLETVKQ